MLKFCYGPFASRRLGLSLGVNVLGEQKRCTFNCMYCEAGRTVGNKLVPPTYIADIKPEGFCEEIKPILKNLQRDLDSITFGYNGEPTLNPHLGEFLQIVREIQRDLAPNPGDKFPIATLFTNSSTVTHSEIRHTLAQFDLILAKFEVGTQADLQRVNRPHSEVPSLAELTRGLAALKQEIPPGHKLALQTLIFTTRDSVKANFREIDLPAWIERVLAINPDIVQLYSVARTPAEPFVIAQSGEVLQQIRSQLVARAGKISSIDVRVY